MHWKDNAKLWDERKSGFKGITLSPVLALAFWMLFSVAFIFLANKIPSHSVEKGLGLSYWWMALIFLVMWHVVFVGIGFIFHRTLAHKACELHPIVLYPLLILSLPAGTPIQWVGNHRHHHTVSDREKDWQSPHAHGFWGSHGGWYLFNRHPLVGLLYSLAGPLRTIFDGFWRTTTNQEYTHLAKDLEAVPFIKWISQPGPFAFFVISQIALSWCSTYLLFGTDGFLPLYLLQVAFYAVGDGTSSIVHMWGHRPFKSGDQSVNVPIIGFILVGEQHHNTHHAFPRSMNAGVLPGDFDLIYHFALLLERLGLCKKIVVPSSSDILKRLSTEKYRAYFERLIEKEARELETRTRRLDERIRDRGFEPLEEL